LRQVQGGRPMPTDFPAWPDAFCAMRVPSGRWSAPRCEPSRLTSAISVTPGNVQKPIPGRAAYRVGFALPAGIPNAINAVLRPLPSILYSSHFSCRFVLFVVSRIRVGGPCLLAAGLSPLGHDHVRATVEESKYPAREGFFIPSATRSYTLFGLCFYAEFRYDSCNPAPG
jgi:hypothetical protein